MAQKERLIESCCTERLLPALLREAKGGAATWLTMGDVTLKRYSESLARLAGNRTQTTLVVRRPDLQMMRWAKRWLDMGWTTELRIMSREDCRELVREELSGHMSKVVLAVDETVDDEMLSWEGELGTVVVCGRMLSVVEAGIKTYAGYFGVERGVMRELLEATEARIKRHRVDISPSTGDATQNGDSPRSAIDDSTEGTVPTVSPTVSPKKSKGKKADVQTSPDPS